LSNPNGFQREAPTFVWKCSLTHSVAGLEKPMARSLISDVAPSEIIGVEVLPPTLSALKVRHPGLSFELTLSNGIEDILRHDADIAVRMTRPVQDSLAALEISN